MSHFYTGVIISKDFYSTNIARDIEDRIHFLLAPYDENLEVEEYDTDCGCIGASAREAARKKLDKVTGETWDEVRDKFNKENINPYTFGTKEYAKEYKKQEKKWEEVFKPRNKIEEDIFNKHPEKDRADPKCSSCEGIGTYKSTYNSKSKWDWYVIGGRWDGEIKGKRAISEDGGFNFSDEHSKVINNYSFTDEMLKDEKTFPYALVLPDGSWYEQGEMGWWGVAFNEKDEETHLENIRKILKKYPGYIMIGCDLHI